MKERKKDTNVAEADWHGTWRTNTYFQKAKSNFAFHLYEALAALSDEDAAATFRVPRYIRDAIRFATHANGMADD